MPLWLAVVLLIAALTGIALACKYLQKEQTGARALHHRLRAAGAGLRRLHRSDRVLC